MNVTLLALLVSAHFIGDFAFQSQWMAENKGKLWEVNAYHVLVYTATIFLVAAMAGFTLPLIALAGIAVSHFLFDTMKARWGLVKTIWLDQILHLLVLAAIAALL